TNVSVKSKILVTFSESVSAGTGAFALSCGSAPQPFTQSALPSNSFTLTPASVLPYSMSCTVTVTAAQITDTDTNDPPDQMESNSAFSFTTASPIDTAPTVSSTTPANSANHVAINTSIVVNFSESVTATAGAFTLQCPTGS